MASLGNVCDAGMWLAWLGLEKLDANLVCIWTMWDFNKARDANFQFAFFVSKSVMLTSRVDLWTWRSLVLYYHVCGCLEHVKLV